MTTEATAKPVTLNDLNSGLPPYVPPPTPAHVLEAMPDVISAADLAAAGFSPHEIQQMIPDAAPTNPAPAQVAEQQPAPAVPEAPAAPAVVPQVDVPPVAEAPPPAAAATAAPIVIPVAPDLAALQAQIAAEEAKRAAARAKWDEGEINTDELMAASSAIDKAIGALQAQGQLAQSNYAAQLEAVKAVWNPAVTAYQQANPHLVADQATFEQWDAALKSVTSNMQYRGMTADQMIRVAHAQLAAAHKARTGQDLDPPGKAAAAPAAQPAAAPAGREPGPRTDPRPPAPLTLAGFTAAEANAPDGSRYGAIWALIESGDAIAAENALAQLSPAEREAFLAGA